MAPKSENMSRADQVRERRKIEPAKRKPIPNPAQFAARNQANSSRVASRRTYTSSQGQQYTNYTQNRKRIYMSTGTPGNEVRLPALPRIVLSWRLLSGFIAVVMALGLYLLTNSSTFMVSAVNLTGGIRIPAEEITASLDVTGESIVNVIPADVEAQILEKFPDIKSAKVKVSLPSVLDLVIEERIPALVWLQDENPLYWVDQDGFTFPIRGEATLPVSVHSNGEPPRPLGYGETADPVAAAIEDKPKSVNSEPAVDPDFVSTVQKINTIIPAGSPLLYNTQNGLGWTDPHGWQVYFGTDTQQIDLKLVEYDQIVKTILDKNLQPKLISLEFLHAPYYRME